MAANRKSRLKLATRIAAYKMERGCDVCGYNSSSKALDFHHTDRDKKRKAVSSLISYGKNVVWNEIDKCILLCANCHREEK